MSRTRISTISVVAAIALIAIIPQVITDRYFIHLLNMTGLYVILTFGLNLLAGLTGQVSLGHAGFYGLGAYTSALLATHFGWSLAVTLPAAVLMTAFVGALVGLPSVRLKGPYLAMTTLGFGQIIQLLMVNWIDLTQGPMGVTGIPSASLFGFSFEKPSQFFYLILGSVVLLGLAFARLKSGPVGRAWTAIRDSDLAAEAMGINQIYYKTLAFAVCSAYAGWAGALWSHYSSYISPDQFPFSESFTMVCMVVLGGRGSVTGSVLGALLLTFLPEYMRGLGDWRLVIYGAVLVLVVIGLPGGMMGVIKQLTGRVRSWNRSEPDKGVAS